MIRHYRDLKVWRTAIELVTEVYRITDAFPTSEKYGLVSQMRQAAVSIPSNIAEGHARESQKEFSRHLLIAAGSVAELETQAAIAVNLQFAAEASQERMLRLADEVGRMIRSLRSRLTAALS